MFKSKKKKAETSSEPKVWYGEDLGFATNEAYKRLRANLLFSFAGKDKYRVIGITSSLPGEGKSSVALNLSYSLSLIRKRVLLMECDLRKPVFSKRLQIPPTPGLSNVLVGDVTKGNKVITPINDSEFFHVMTAGDIPPNPSELVGSEEMKIIFDTLSDNYDFIIVDLPPVSAVSDPLAISNYLDGMVVVVRSDYTNKSLLKDTMQNLELTGVKLLGYVFNTNLNDSKDKYYSRKKRYYEKNKHSYKYSHYEHKEK